MKFLENYSKYSHLLLRIVLGLAFIGHGYGKLWGSAPGLDPWIGMMAGLGFPAFVAYLVAILELLGGIAVLLGVFTRYSALLIAVIMVFSTILVKFKAGYFGGWELDFAYFGIALSLALSGAGEFSVDKKKNW